jgi:hypothetical protein
VNDRLPTAREVAEWQFADELMRRQRDDESVGWEPGPGEPEYDRDITKDRCRACGRPRGSVEVEYELDGRQVTGTEVPDPCLGMLPGVLFACCGHGRHGNSVYISGPGVRGLTGPAAALKMRELGGDPPPAAFLLDPLGPGFTWRPRS